eukprot:3791926-Alexandrium_andersonii.AAC.1
MELIAMRFVRGEIEQNDLKTECKRMLKERFGPPAQMEPSAPLERGKAFVQAPLNPKKRPSSKVETQREKSGPESEESGESEGEAEDEAEQGPPKKRQAQTKHVAHPDPQSSSSDEISTDESP